MRRRGGQGRGWVPLIHFVWPVVWQKTERARESGRRVISGAPKAEVPMAPTVSTCRKSLLWAEVLGTETSTEKVKGIGGEEMETAGHSCPKCGPLEVIETSGGFPCGRGISPQRLLSLPGNKQSSSRTVGTGLIGSALG